MEVKSKRLQAKDLINVGIFYRNLLCHFLCRYDVRIYPHLHSTAGACMPDFVRDPIYAVLNESQKFGMVTLTGVILGLLNLIMGSGVLVLVGGIIFGVVSDLILRAGKYQSWKCVLLGNGVFSLLDYGICKPHVFDPGRFLFLSCEQLRAGICEYADVLYSRLDVPCSIRRDLHRWHLGSLAWKSRIEEAF